jgi:hypothetical protein
MGLDTQRQAIQRDCFPSLLGESEKVCSEEYNIFGLTIAAKAGQKSIVPA